MEEPVAVPPVFATQIDSYLVRPAYVRLRAIAPEWTEEEVRLCISPPGKQVQPDAYERIRDTIWIRPPARYFTIIPPIWDTLQEAIPIVPAHQTAEVRPIQYRWVPEYIEVSPPGRRWVRKKAQGCLDSDPERCTVWCLVEVPAKQQVIYRQEPIGCDSEDPNDCVRYNAVPAQTVLKTVVRLREPARAIEHMDPGAFQLVERWVLRPGQKEPSDIQGAPGEYQTFRRRILRREASFQADTVPAEYAPIERKVLLSDGGVSTRVLPAEYAPVLKRRLVERRGYWTWREVLCEEQLTQVNIRQVQEALQARGYYKGRIDGVLNAQTKTAIAQFQSENELPPDGNLDIETLQALGLGG